MILSTSLTSANLYNFSQYSKLPYANYFKIRVFSRGNRKLFNFGAGATAILARKTPASVGCIPVMAENRACISFSRGTNVGSSPAPLASSLVKRYRGEISG